MNLHGVPNNTFNLSPNFTFTAISYIVSYTIFEFRCACIYVCIVRIIYICINYHVGTFNLIMQLYFLIPTKMTINKAFYDIKLAHAVLLF